MDRQTIIEGPHASLWYYPGERVVHHEIRSFVHGEEFRSLLTKGLEILGHCGCRKWVSDDRRSNALTREDGEWAQTVWRPLAVAAGWNTWALVEPESVAGQMYLRRRAAQFRKLGIAVKVFASPDEALAWIVRQ